jgi:hypothetical protein
VGISALSERGQRDFASAAIAVHDASWRRVHYVHLPHEGMILDLEPLQEAEYASAAKRGLGARSFPILDRLDETDLAADQGSATKVST